jgi:hypothetical protein
MNIQGITFWISVYFFWLSQRYPMDIGVPPGSMLFQLVQNTGLKRCSTRKQAV